MPLSIHNLIELCRSVGFTEAQIPMAVAIALAESGGDPLATNQAGNTPPSTDRGLWQINSYWHNEVSDHCAFDPVCCAREALRISGGANWSQWSTFGNGAYKQFLPAIQREMGATAMSMGYWSVRNPWNATVAIDEFGPGTLTGNPADGHSTDACAAAAVENSRAALEQRTPTYANIGALRVDMMRHGQWTKDAQGVVPPITNPSTNGAYIQNVAWAIARDARYTAVDLHVDTGADISAWDVHNLLALHPGIPHIFLVINAQALMGNEHNVLGHYVAITAYGGDNADGSFGKVYVLNSDIAGQHGVATGQWMTIDAFCAAQPMGHVAMGRATQTPPPPPEVAPVVIIEKDAAGTVTGAHDATNATLRLGAGIAAAVETNHWAAGTITVPEVATPDGAIKYAVLRGGAKVLLTYSDGVGVHAYGGDAVVVVDTLYHQTTAAKPPTPTKPNYDHLIGAVESDLTALHDALKQNGEVS